MRVLFMRVLLLTLVLACAAPGQWPTSPLWTPEQLGAGIVTQRFDASTLGLANGGSVNAWPDSSGNGYTATPANAGACTGGAPTYTTNVWNGMGMVSFGTSSNRCFTTPYTGQTASVFVVGGAINGGGSDPVVLGQDTSDTANDVFGWWLANYRYGGSTFCRGVVTEWNGICSVLAPGDGGSWAGPLNYYYGLINGDVNGNTASLLINGSLVNSTTSAAAKRPLSSFVLGAYYRNHAPSNPMPGNIGEVITTTELTATQRQQITNYLSAKWFLTPPQTYEFAVFHQWTTWLVMNILTSSDAATWTDSPNSYAAGFGSNMRFSPVRDPSIALINGTWWIVHTNPNSPNSFSLAKSADRGLWQFVQAVTIPGGTATGVAPEWFVDEDGSPHVLFWAGDGTNGCPAGNYCIQETHPTNASFTAWSTPVTLSTPDDTKVIDPFLMKIGSTYYLFTVSKSSGTVGKLFTSGSLLGPYSYVRTLTGTNEGPSVIRMDGKWRLY